MSESKLERYKPQLLLGLLVVCIAFCVFASSVLHSNSSPASVAATSKAVRTHAAAADSSSTVATSAAAAATSAPAASAQSATTSASSVQTAASAAIPADLPRLPKVGMSAQYLDATELGTHDSEGDVLTGGKWKGGKSYYWDSKNGKNDHVYSAIVLNGKVVNVSKWNTSLNYWADGTIVGKDFPDLYATGDGVEKTSSAPQYVDPLDYTDPGEYADNAEEYFRYQGSDDPWNEAYNYWELNGP